MMGAMINENTDMMARDLVAETAGIESGCIRCLRIVQICKDRGLSVDVKAAAVELVGYLLRRMGTLQWGRTRSASGTTRQQQRST